MYKALIRSLLPFKATHQKRKQEIGDIVRANGNGVVYLLHGPPGVGKTVFLLPSFFQSSPPRQWQRRRVNLLLSASLAEIGLDAAGAQRSLEKLFRLATRWEALIGRRDSGTNASRNILTTVFLHSLDQYRGDIILMTDRVELAIDDAIINRIHLAIPYYHVSNIQTGAIFKHFLDQVEPSRIQDCEKIDEFIMDTGHHYDLSERQIRNVVVVVLVLARQQRARIRGHGKLTEDIRRLCKMARESQERLSGRPLAQ
ncbi:hypothetical protein B0T25DRAFT_457195 [Lasiosphaeria hispida]|uniref:AAA+ ATPase domain-containing protein n=1 Tax=Lasiosphaeria hispida TaxID=260671 RepID=A0AAJ0HGG6_9PEZI|nr:hypothetical protein B0T25DRAFT_457195 [Lasiosphaeria hispida]